MQSHGNIRALIRAIGVMSAVLIILGGVTYAALQSQQAVLAGNTVTTASADLKISRDNLSYDSSMPGFSFSDVIPGGPLVPLAGHSFYLKNSGSIATTLKVSVSGMPTNTSNVDLSKTSVVFTKVPGGPTQTYTLAALISSHATGGLVLADSLGANTTHNYKVQISMTTDAFNGQGATLGSIDFVFMGTAITP
jgi:hypothetical protein